MSTTRIVFTADIVLEDRDIDLAGGLEQAVQNEIGFVGARIVKVVTIADGKTLRNNGMGFVGEPIHCPKCGRSSPCDEYGPGCP